ncbi:hypothetical protein A3Q56_05395 [Intoshia linei]|uniref:ribonuclease Z n=1 Tax=Intoshia linei TaxID=1819745 RepID=A0A177AZH2_9BILA|nr:hypothetical protein A3Q56_05395 [Intoshia linei]
MNKILKGVPKWIYGNRKKYSLFDQLRNESIGENVQVNTKSYKYKKFNKSINEIQSAYKIHINVLSNGKFGTAKSFIISINGTNRYLINCGEGTIRLIHNMGFQIKSFSDILYTRNTWQCYGGSLPFFLTLNRTSSEKLRVHADALTLKNIVKSSYLSFCTHLVNFDLIDTSKLSEKSDNFTTIKYIFNSNGIKDNSDLECYNCYLINPNNAQSNVISIRKLIEHGLSESDIILLKTDKEKFKEKTLIDPANIYASDCIPASILILDFKSILEWNHFKEMFNKNMSYHSTISIIVHLSDSDITESVEYKVWLLKCFSHLTSSNHLYINENYCMSLFSRCCNKLKKLNQVSTSIHPLPKEFDVEFKDKKTFALRPKFEILREPINFKRDVYYDEVSFKYKKLQLQHSNEDINVKTKNEYPIFVFLGTSSTMSVGDRNVSGIVVHIDLASKIDIIKRYKFGEGKTHNIKSNCEKMANFTLSIMILTLYAYNMAKIDNVYTNIRNGYNDIWSSSNDTSIVNVSKIIFIGLSYYIMTETNFEIMYSASGLYKKYMPSDRDQPNLFDIFVRKNPYLVTYCSSENSILLDCGELTATQILRYYGQNTKKFLSTLKAIFISHLHADHHMGVLGLCDLRSKLLPNLKSKINLISNHMFMITYRNVFWDNKRLMDSLRFINARALLKKHAIDFNVDDNVNILLKETNVNWIECIPVIHKQFPFGIMILLKNNYKIVYSGDTTPCDALIKSGLYCDVLIHEATNDDDHHVPAQMNRHSTTNQAIQVGRRMNAKHLILTHFGLRTYKMPLINPDVKNVIYAFDFMRIRNSDFDKAKKIVPLYGERFSESQLTNENNVIKYHNTLRANSV